MYLPVFWVIFKILKQLLCTFFCVLGSFIDFDAYLKAWIQFLKLHLGKILFGQ